MNKKQVASPLYQLMKNGTDWPQSLGSQISRNGPNKWTFSISPVLHSAAQSSNCLRFRFSSKLSTNLVADSVLHTFFSFSRFQNCLPERKWTHCLHLIFQTIIRRQEPYTRTKLFDFTPNKLSQTYSLGAGESPVLRSLAVVGQERTGGRPFQCLNSSS